MGMLMGTMLMGMLMGTMLMGILMGTALRIGTLMRLEPMKFLAHGHRGNRASSAPKGHSIVAQGNALGLMAPPHRFPSPVGATLGYLWPIWGSTCRSWDAPSGHCGSFGDRFPGRCPGLDDGPHLWCSGGGG